MELTLNGESRTFPRPMSVAELLVELGVGVERVAVEVNRAVVPRRDHGALALRDGDVVELVTFVGGG